MKDIEFDLIDVSISVVSENSKDDRKLRTNDIQQNHVFSRGKIAGYFHAEEQNNGPTQRSNNLCQSCSLRPSLIW